MKTSGTMVQLHHNANTLRELFFSRDCEQLPKNWDDWEEDIGSILLLIILLLLISVF